jgi:hypothetical protein
LPNGADGSARVPGARALASAIIPLLEPAIATSGSSAGHGQVGVDGLRSRR